MVRVATLQNQEMMAQLVVSIARGPLGDCNMLVRGGKGRLSIPLSFFWDCFGLPDVGAKRYSAVRKKKEDSFEIASCAFPWLYGSGEKLV